MRSIPISDKLILVSMGIITATIIIVGTYSFHYAKVAVLDRTFNQLTSVKSVKSKLIKNFFYNKIEEMKLIKSSTDIQNIIKNINGKEKSAEYKEITDRTLIPNSLFIENIPNKNYRRILLIGTNKRVINLNPKFPISDNDNIKLEEMWKKVKESNIVFLNDLFKNKDSEEPYFTIYSRITNSQKTTIGFIVYEIYVSPINHIMLEKSSSNGLNNSGELYIVGKDKLMRSVSRFDSESVLKTKVNTEAVSLAFNDTITSKIITDYRGIRVLSSFSKLNVQGLNWVIIAEINYAEATIPVYKIGYNIIFISIFIFVAVLLIVIILSRKITNPIVQLHEAARKIGKGVFDINIDYKHKDEIGDLVIAFKDMASQLDTKNKELKNEKDKNLRSLINGQENERQRLSRELHDSLGQLLIGLKLKYENCRNQQEMDNNSFSDLSELFDKTIEETRRISNNLMPAALSEFGLVTAIRHICNTITSSTNINIIFKSQGRNDNLSKNIQTYIFRITQEALTNIVKHSEASNTIINIEFKQDEIILKIEDDGKGFQKSEINHLSSNGLSNIQNRVLLLSGKFKIESKINKGTSITINIPISK